MAEQRKQSDQIGDEELRGFVEKLDTWGASLPLGEKALLQLVLERAAGRGRSAQETDFDFPAARGFGDVVTPFLQEIVSSGALSVRAPDVGTRAVRAWVQAGDPWVQGA